MRWILEPGNDLYLVYDQGWHTGGGRLESTSSAGVLKLDWSIRF